MADTAFTVKVDGKTYVLDRITLGDWRMFKTEFGLNSSDIIAVVPNEKGEPVEILNIDDPNVLVGLLVAALRHERPLAPISSLIQEVEALGLEGLEFPDADASGVPEGEPDPTKDGDDDEVTVPKRKSGSSAKPRKKPGTRS